MNKTITSERAETMEKEQLSSLAQSNGYDKFFPNTNRKGIRKW